MRKVNVGLAITNLFKLVGLAIGLFAPHGAFTQHPEALIICFSGFLMAGAELSEKTIVSMAQKFFVVNKSEPEPSKSESTADTPKSTTTTEK